MAGGLCRRGGVLSRTTMFSYAIPERLLESFIALIVKQWLVVNSINIIYTSPVAPLPCSTLLVVWGGSTEICWLFITAKCFCWNQCKLNTGNVKGLMSLWYTFLKIMTLGPKFTKHGLISFSLRLLDCFIGWCKKHEKKNCLTSFSKWINFCHFGPVQNPQIRCYGGVNWLLITYFMNVRQKLRLFLAKVISTAQRAQGVCSYH